MSATFQNINQRQRGDIELCIQSRVTFILLHWGPNCCLQTPKRLGRRQTSRFPLQEPSILINERKIVEEREVKDGWCSADANSHQEDCPNY